MRHYSTVLALLSLIVLFSSPLSATPSTETFEDLIESRHGPFADPNGGS